MNPGEDLGEFGDRESTATGALARPLRSAHLFESAICEENGASRCADPGTLLIYLDRCLPDRCLLNRRLLNRRPRHYPEVSEVPSVLSVLESNSHRPAREPAYKRGRLL
jgi:hypothetical protein